MKILAIVPRDTRDRAPINDIYRSRNSLFHVQLDKLCTVHQLL
jgi:hypothetical protein